jgi:hypothetical protein
LVGLGVGPVADFLFEHQDRTYARGSRQLELWVRRRGRPIRLVRTGDALRFGQMYRALQRAIERSQPFGEDGSGRPERLVTPSPAAGSDGATTRPA